MLEVSHKSEQVVRCGYVMGQENSEVDSKSRLHSLFEDDLLSMFYLPILMVEACCPRL